MSVMRRAAGRRWAVVAVGVAVLAGVPSVAEAARGWVAARDAGSSGSSGSSGPSGSVGSSSAPGQSEASGNAARQPQALLAAALASTSVAYSGFAESRGNLGLPDLPRLSDVAAQLGGTTRARVWWAGPQQWRVATVTATGEQATYDQDGQLFRWDYEQGRLTEVLTSAPIRLPRTDDLLPPQAAGRLLAGVEPTDRLEYLGRTSVAGVAVDGLRVVPADPQSTIGHLDVWLARDSGLPLRVAVVDARGVLAMQSQFLDVDLTAPASGDLRPPSAPGAVHDTTTIPDLVARLEQIGAWQLPNALAGVPASAPIVGGTATYGSGLTRFVVVPLTPRLAGQVLDAVRTGGGTRLALAHGEALVITSGVLTLVVARGSDAASGGPDHAYLLSGLVAAGVLTAATQDLLAHPPAARA